MGKYSSQVLARSGLAAYFRQGESSGLPSPFTAADSSSNNIPAVYRNSAGSLDGVALGEPGFLIGDSGTCALYDGVNGCLGVNDNPGAEYLQFSGPVSLVTFAVVTAFPTNGNVMTIAGVGGTTQSGPNGAGTESYRLILVGLSSSVQLQFGSYDGTFSNGTSNTGLNHQTQWTISGWTTGQKVHLAGTYDRRAWNLYFNGVLVASTPDPVGALITSGGRFFIGCEYMYSGGSLGLYRFFSGSTGETAIYGRGLTAAEIAEDYSQSTLSPGSLTVVQQTGTGVILRYATVTFGVAPYSNQLQRSTTSGTGYSSVSAPVAGNVCTLTDTTAISETTYYYQVVTTDSTGAAATSAPLEVFSFNLLQATHVNRKFGAFLGFQLSTFYSSDTVPPTTDPTNLFGNSTHSGSFSQMPLNMGTWLSQIALTGATFVIFVTTHSGGLCLWPSASCPRNIKNTAWYANNSVDLVKLFVTTCRQLGLSPYLYVTMYDNWYEDGTPATGSMPGISPTPARNTFFSDRLAELAGYQPDGFYIDNDYQSNTSFEGNSYVPYSVIESAIKTVAPNAVILSNNQLYSLSSTDVIEREWPASGGGEVPIGNLLPENNTLTVYESDPSQSGTAVVYFDHGNAPTLWSASFLTAYRSRQLIQNSTVTFNYPVNRDGSFLPATLALMEAIGPSYTASVPSTIPMGSTATIIYTCTQGGTFSTGDSITPSDTVGGRFGSLIFVNGASTATQTYTPAVAGTNQIVFSNGQSMIDPNPATIVVGTLSGDGALLINS